MVYFRLAAVAVIGGALVGCQRKDPATDPARPTQNTETASLQSLWESNPSVRVGRVTAVAPDRRLASVGEMDVGGLQKGNVVTFLDANGKTVNLGTISSIQAEGLHVKYDEPIESYRAPSVGDMAVRVIQTADNAMSTMPPRRAVPPVLPPNDSNVSATMPADENIESTVPPSDEQEIPDTADPSMDGEAAPSDATDDVDADIPPPPETEDTGMQTTPDDSMENGAAEDEQPPVTQPSTTTPPVEGEMGDESDTEFVVPPASDDGDAEDVQSGETGTDDAVPGDGDQPDGDTETGSSDAAATQPAEAEDLDDADAESAQPGETGMDDAAPGDGDQAEGDAESGLDDEETTEPAEAEEPDMNK